MGKQRTMRPRLIAPVSVAHNAMCRQIALNPINQISVRITAHRGKADQLLHQFIRRHNGHSRLLTAHPDMLPSPLLLLFRNIPGAWGLAPTYYGGLGAEPPPDRLRQQAKPLS